MKKILPDISRRELVTKVGGGAAVVAAVVVAPSVAGAAGKKRFAMVIDTRRCSGCQACSIACKTEFDMPLGGFRSWVEHIETGDFPNTTRNMEPRLCNQCSKPPCIEVCPTEKNAAGQAATYKRDEDGIVVVDQDRCTGCARCIRECPYDARSINPKKGNPALTKGVGAAEKCDFCIHRVSQGVAPACVNTCPGKARVFGDLNDPSSDVAKLVDEFDTTVLLRGKKTKPSVFYIGADYMEAKQASGYFRIDSNRLERDTKRHV